MSIIVEVFPKTNIGATINFAPIIKGISAEYNSKTMTITAEVEDETSSSNLVYLWDGGVTFVGANDSNPVVINYPSVSVSITLTVTDELNAVGIATFYASPRILPRGRKVVRVVLDINIK